MYISDSGDTENSSLTGCGSLPLGKWFSTFRSIVVSLSLSGFCIGCWTLGSLNTKRFFRKVWKHSPIKAVSHPRGHGTFYYLPYDPHVILIATLFLCSINRLICQFVFSLRYELGLCACVEEINFSLQSPQDSSAATHEFRFSLPKQ